MQSLPSLPLDPALANNEETQVVPATPSPDSAAPPKDTQVDLT